MRSGRKRMILIGVSVPAVALAVVLVLAHRFAGAPPRESALPSASPDVTAPATEDSPAASTASRSAYQWPQASGNEKELVLADSLRLFATRTAWSWQKDGDPEPPAENWQAAWEDAQAYFYQPQLDRSKLLQLYQRVIDSAPPPEIELRARLQMGAAMVIGFEPFMDAEAISWYAETILKLGDLGTHRDLMVAKLHMADLLNRNYDPLKVLPVVNALYAEVINVPEDEIMFDGDSDRMYNLDAIENAVGPSSRQFTNEQLQNVTIRSMVEKANAQYKQQLMEQRKQLVDALRRSAITAYAWKQRVPGLPNVTILRLEKLKATRPDDTVYQEAIDDVLGRLNRAIKKAKRNGVMDEDSVIESLK